MEPVLTIVCKRNPTPEQGVKLDKALQGFAGDCNYIQSTVDPKVTNKNHMQVEVYKEVRAQFGLSTNLAVNHKERKPIKFFKPTASGQEKRYQAWVNHNISQSIITQAKSSGGSIAIEDLTGCIPVKLVLLD